MARKRKGRKDKLLPFKLKRMKKSVSDDGIEYANRRDELQGINIRYSNPLESGASKIEFNYDGDDRWFTSGKAFKEAYENRNIL